MREQVGEGQKELPIWFGGVVMLNREMGPITPPVGLNLYVVQRIARTSRCATSSPARLPTLPCWQSG